MIDHFGRLARWYDRIIRFDDAVVMIQVAGLPADGRLLDAGGGTGRVSGLLKGYLSQVVVADLSVGMLRQAALRHLETTCAYSERLPFADNTFERIIMVDALHHVCDQQRTAEELWRVLCPGGRLVIVEPDIRFFVVKLIALFEKIVLMRSHFLSSRQLLELFPFEGAAKRIEHRQYNLWAVIEKVSSG